MADSIIGKISVGDGATFTPDVTDGVLSFTNNKNLPNPEPYNIAAKVLDEGENELRTLVTAAETAAGNAATSATNAHNSEQAAKASETAAATSARAAKTSETNAASSKTAAATSATNAATSETNASNSASAAATSESNASDSATAAAASAAEVEAALDDYLPLSGGTLTGVVNGVTPPNGDNSKKLATTEFVNAKAGNYLPLTGGRITGSIQCVDNGKVFAIGKTAAGNVDLGWSWDNREGAGLGLRSTDYESPGEFMLFARDANNDCSLKGKPDGTLTWNGQPLLPVGIVQAFAGKTIPSGWLLCDGSAVSRTDYAALYAVIGTTYGAGNGSTTFNLPNLVDKFVEGSATAGTVKSAGLPNITAAYDDNIGYANANMIGWHGAVYLGNVAGSLITSNRNGDGNDYCHNWKFDASHSNSIYGNSTTVQPPALTMRYIIKY